MQTTFKTKSKPRLNAVMTRVLLAIFFLVSILNRHETAKIFAWFPTPSISHQFVFRRLTQELVRRGHELTVVTPDPAYPVGQTPANLIEIDVHNISYDIWRETFMTQYRKLTRDSQTIALFRASLEVVDAQLDTKEMKTIIKGNEKFDLLILEACSIQALVITHIYKVPVILISSFGNFLDQLEDFGAPGHPFLYPGTLFRNNFNLTMWDKIVKLYELWKLTTWYKTLAPISVNITRKHFGDDFPQVNVLKKNVDMIFINELFRENRPVPPGVVYIGGIHRKPRKDLPEDLKSFLDSSKHGVIFVSFGTNAVSSMFPAKTVRVFTKVFSELPYDVLWKWDGDLPDRPQNIRISKWLPQADLLYHPNVKLFITQGGLQSVEESIMAGVPMIGIPLILDQWYNVESCVRHRIGLHLEMEMLDETQLREAIEAIIGDPSYSKNIKKLRDEMSDKPIPPLDLAVWWTEYVLRNGGAKHLRAPTAFMPWWQYYELQMVFVVSGVIIIVCVAGIAMMYYAVKFLQRTLLYRTKVKVT